MLTWGVFRCEQWKRHKHKKSESSWSGFFFRCKDMSMRSFDVCIVENLCPLNFATPLLRSSHHQCILSVSFPLSSFFWAHWSLSPFCLSFPSIFHVRGVQNVTAKYLAKGHLVCTILVRTLQRKTQQQQDASIISPTSFVTLIETGVDPIAREREWVRRPVQLANLQVDEWLSWLSNYSTRNYHHQGKKYVLSHSHACAQVYII